MRGTPPPPALITNVDPFPSYAAVESLSLPTLHPSILRDMTKRGENTMCWAGLHSVRRIQDTHFLSLQSSFTRDVVLTDAS